VKHDLIERYVYAITRQLPSKMRADVEMELDSLITEMLNERCGPILPTEKDIRVVLTELGTPFEMAAKYSGEEQKSLISGSYFLIYKRVLKIILPIVAIAVPFALVLSTVLDQPDDPYSMVFTLIWQIIGGMLAGVFQAFSIVTFIFAILERQKEKIVLDDFLSSLPSVPKKDEQIKPAGPIFGIVFSIVAVALLLGIPQIFGIYLDGSGWLPILNVEVWRSLWLPIVLWAVLGVIKESVRLAEARYTICLAIVTVAVNILAIICSAAVFLNNAIINPDLLQKATSLITGEGTEFIHVMITNCSVILLAVICLGLAIDIVTVCAKALRARSSS